MLQRGGLGFPDLAVFLHGTTLATNAVIERNLLYEIRDFAHQATLLMSGDVCFAGSVAKLAVRGARVRFSRTETEALEPSERARRANALDAEIFVSLHLNATNQPSAHGTSTFHFVSSGAGAALGEAIGDWSELGGYELPAGTTIRSGARWFSASAIR